MSSQTDDQYVSGSHTVLRVYLENGGRFMCLNDDKTLSMVDREYATQFYLNQHVYIADMRVTYEIIPALEASYDERFQAFGEIRKSYTSYIESNKTNQVDISKYNLTFQEHLNEHNTLESISISVKVNDTVWAMDNYGDGRVVWWNMDKNRETDQLTAKTNQKFKLIFT